jgi:hypothetical protein
LTALRYKPTYPTLSKRWGAKMRVRSQLIILAILTTILVHKSVERSYSATLPSDEEVSGILKACAGGRFQQIEGDLEAKISMWKRGVEASGKASKEDLGAILKQVPQNQQISPELYKTYTDCILNAMSKYLTALPRARHLSPSESEKIQKGLSGKNLAFLVIDSGGQEPHDYGDEIRSAIHNAEQRVSGFSHSAASPAFYGLEILKSSPPDGLRALSEALTAANLPYDISDGILPVPVSVWNQYQGMTVLIVGLHPDLKLK